jgi:nucleoside-diphosphate-sugar epimerase
VRDPARATHLQSLGVQLITGDLADTRALCTLVSDCTAVVHGAGAVRGNNQEDFDRVNVTGTRAVVDAMAAHAPAARLVHLSSLAAREAMLSYYSRSKARGEAVLAEHSDLDWVVLRPPAVYGPGDVEMLPLFRTMYRGLALVPGSVEARTSLIHVDDLTRAIIACLACKEARHQVFHLGDGTAGGYSWAEMAAIGQDLWSRRVRLWQIPAWILDSVAFLNSRRARFIGGAPMLTPQKLRELRHPDWVVSNEAITRVTGWEPGIALREGLQALQIPAL